MKNPISPARAARPGRGAGFAVSQAEVSRARGVVNALFAEDYQRTWQRLAGWSNPELRGDEYVLDEDVSKFLADEPAEAKT